MKACPSCWNTFFMNERKLLQEKYFILVNMFYTVKGSIIRNVINFCFMKATSNRKMYKTRPMRVTFTDTNFLLQILRIISNLKELEEKYNRISIVFRDLTTA